MLEFLDQYPLWVIILLSIPIGIAVGYFLYRLQRATVIERAEATYDSLIEEATNKADLLMLDASEKIQDFETECWSREEKTMVNSEERIEELEEICKEKKKKADDFYSVKRQQTLEFETHLKSDEKRVQDKDQQLQEKRFQAKELLNKYVENLCQKSNISRESARAEVIREIEIEIEKRSLSMATQKEEFTKEHAEFLAKGILSLILDRFARPYCAERGIPAVYFENPEQRKFLFDEKGENIKALIEATGCDIVLEESLDFIGVAGFDSVRRELARRTLEKLLKERRLVNPEVIKRTAENQKKELLRQIVRDGDTIAKDLKLEGLHSDIRRMMGSLRFRYSFTQNQYFHCSEVGFLCGLLASELGGLSIRRGRRAGMLHDLGKSMDHELDGGHAVIGADFIEKRGEAVDIVHAVRAHHFDEQPDTDLAYLVVAADAISGARPGARRSMIESYTQKVTELESIAKSFDGVLDCYVLSGGRELRVIVNSKKIDDVSALKLSRRIATQIENEVNYPGQIKVVVVRETLITEMTKMHA